MIGARLLGSFLSPAGERARLSILIYHRVLPAQDPLFPQEVDAARFDAQMRLVGAHFNVLPLAEAAERLQLGALPARAACITFDDGYADNVEIALPILQQHGLSATFFIATDYLDGGRMWNDDVIEAVRGAVGPELDLNPLGLGWHVVRSATEKRATIDAIIGLIKYLPEQEREQVAARIAGIAQTVMPANLMMTSAQVRALHAAGMTIGGHTAHHPILARVRPAEAKQEIACGKETLEGIVGERISLFAYPNGKPNQDYTREHVSMVRELGFRTAVSTAWGAAKRNTDVFQLPRFTPWDFSPHRFLLRMLNNLRHTHSEHV